MEGQIRAMSCLIRPLYSSSTRLLPTTNGAPCLATDSDRLTPPSGCRCLEECVTSARVPGCVTCSDAAGAFRCGSHQPGSLLSGPRSAAAIPDLCEPESSIRLIGLILHSAAAPAGGSPGIVDRRSAAPALPRLDIARPMVRQRKSSLEMLCCCPHLNINLGWKCNHASPLHLTRSSPYDYTFFKPAAASRFRGGCRCGICRRYTRSHAQGHYCRDGALAPGTLRVFAECTGSSGGGARSASP
jgi:hypothetical protein